MNNNELCVAADTLTLKSIHTLLTENKVPYIFEMFNQIKQEYVYARFMCFQWLSIPHESYLADRDTYITDLHNDSIYSTRVEGLKSSFRYCYSLLDRMGFAINEYWHLELKKRDVSIFKVCDRILKNELYVTNKYLCGIVLTVDELRDKDTSMNRLKELRHALEHRFLIVTKATEQEKSASNKNEHFVYISDCDLYDCALELLENIRELIIAFVLAVQTEENKRASGSKCVETVELKPMSDFSKL